ncbi:Hypothetical predicted protein [Olea europaea subsp. europaea]|uniref:Epidermal patterning factor-like protein n=1 Tax=Olea europaea subsp. europaea TaxID=158383 RepID=A0A8S0T607_OLEEU|nr:Hypothetical predicted protein [Olea europaea subsp. europaea]
MGVLRHRHQCTISFATIAFLLLTSVSAFGINPTRQFRRKIKQEVVERVLPRRRLGGPGSSPPTCRSKCGKCLPCKPVHVPIHPGVSMPLEYYPEAWRCKCGNKLFMP